ncbi:cation/H(+) antiporter 5-like [Humulus lupulus]|uniref:cation/H(+) antiporter 5-like n=1 Tax=Humulus lupulus TaxID=3486 RepID=UPI002B407669|nr:cation/H(+) antiporter 5-like [Humulus lupulus]
MIKADPHDLNLNTKVSRANALLVLVITVSKFVFSLIPPKLSRMPFKDGLVIAFIMSYKGVVEMASYGIARDSKVIELEVYCFVMATVLVTAIVVPVSVRYLYNPKSRAVQKRFDPITNRPIQCQPTAKNWISNYDWIGSDDIFKNPILDRSVLG